MHRKGKLLCAQARRQPHVCRAAGHLATATYVAGLIDDDAEIDEALYMVIDSGQLTSFINTRRAQ